MVSERDRQHADDVDPISSDFFGGIYTGYRGFDAYSQHDTLLGLTNIRWPGGTLSETRPDVYDLNLPEVFDARNLYQFNADRQRPGLSEVLEYSVSENIGFSMLVPTARYSTDIQRGIDELDRFLDRLLGGEFGELPTDFTLELGNEYYALDEFKKSAGLYGAVAAAFTDTIASAVSDPSRNPSSYEINIAVQMGRTHNDNLSIISEFSASQIGEIDKVIFHHLPIGFNNMASPIAEGDPEDIGDTRIQNTKDNYDFWVRAMEAAVADPRKLELAMTAWNVGGTHRIADDFLLEFNDYGLQAASTMIHMVHGYSSIGVASADVWGIDNQWFNALSDENDTYSELSVAGATFALLSANLVGTSPIAGPVDQTREDPFLIYAFQSSGKLVVYISANDISGDGATVEIDIGLSASETSISATRLSAELPLEYAEFATTNYEELYQTPILEAVDFQQAGDSVSFSFSQDYETVQLVVETDKIKGWTVAPSNKSEALATASDFIRDLLGAEPNDDFEFAFDIVGTENRAALGHNVDLAIAAPANTEYSDGSNSLLVGPVLDEFEFAGNLLNDTDWVFG